MYIYAGRTCGLVPLCWTSVINYININNCNVVYVNERYGWGTVPTVINVILPILPTLKADWILRTYFDV